MNRIIIVGTVLAGVLQAATAGEPLDLDQVIHRAQAKPSQEASDLAIAQNRVLWLEALKRRRIALTPQMALLLANPISLSAGLGAGLMLNGDRVSPLTLLDAKIDLVGAEIAVEHSRFQRELEATEKYMALELQQKVSNETCQSVTKAQDRRDEAQEALDAARATRLDLIRYEQAILDRRGDCLRADQEVQLAALRLATLLEVDSDGLRVAGAATQSSSGTALQPVQALYALAQNFRPATSMENKIADLRQQLDQTRDKRLQLVLKDNGQFPAEKLLLGEKIRRLERQVAELHQQVQTRIAEIRIRLETIRDETDFARQRLALASEQQRVTTARLHAGLATRSDAAEADDLHRRADLELARLRHEDTAAVAALVAVCGLSDKPAVLRALVYSRTVFEAALPR
jgi:outer membrane protein TolC